MTAPSSASAASAASAAAMDVAPPSWTAALDLAVAHVRATSNDVTMPLEPLLSCPLAPTAISTPPLVVATTTNSATAGGRAGHAFSATAAAASCLFQSPKLQPSAQPLAGMTHEGSRPIASNPPPPAGQQIPLSSRYLQHQHFSTSSSVSGQMPPLATGPSRVDPGVASHAQPTQQRFAHKDPLLHSPPDSPGHLNGTTPPFPKVAGNSNAHIIQPAAHEGQSSDSPHFHTQPCGDHHLTPEYQQGEEFSVPIFRPSMAQFRNFEAFVRSIEPYGKKAGLVKIIPPQEWKDECLSASDISNRLSKVRIRGPIEQNFCRGHLPNGAYTQTNLVKRMNVSVQEWYNLCQRNRTPALNADGKCHANTVAPRKRRRQGGVGQPPTKESMADDSASAIASNTDRSPTLGGASDESLQPPSHDAGLPDDAAPDSSMVQEQLEKKRSRRRRDLSGEEPIEFDLDEVSAEFDLAYCKELEKVYWKDLMYSPPMYGADMLGSLFDDNDKNTWNLRTLDNILNRMNCSIPGVNQPYLYFGMWKATFAWHVEDVDLYSINYIHFGAPKQWYVIPPAMARRFECCAQACFPKDACDCQAFLRHKTSLMSPTYLASNGIKVLRLVQQAGEFVITFPFGYHAGFNLGFNCAESVNFATEDWIEVGRKATVCHCIKDSVRLDVDSLFKQAQPDPFVSSMENPAEAVDEAESVAERSSADRSKRKLGVPKRPRVKPRPPTPEPEPEPPVSPRLCALCPDESREATLETEFENVFAHRRCAEFVPETAIVPHPFVDNQEIVVGVGLIPKDRWALKCQFCKPLYGRRNRVRGACIQCYKGRCVRTYHVSCADANRITMTDAFMCFCPQHDGGRRQEILRAERDALESVADITNHELSFDSYSSLSSSASDASVISSRLSGSPTPSGAFVVDF
ncbi:JmjC domain, hydroxylase-domain-containing protein [Zopfochytrium polystomum]|nr:JmjC domain, hydroxylase-domain-containing protein [Zopfochytrium polystomum]